MDCLLKKMDGLIQLVDTIIIEESRRVRQINGRLYPPNTEGLLELKGAVIHDVQSNSYTVQCPYCNEFTEVKMKHMNCKIFRHAAFKPKDEKHVSLYSHYKPINPHEGWRKISQYLTEDCIIGCGGAFKVVGNPKEDKNNLYTLSCSYEERRRPNRDRQQKKGQKSKQSKKDTKQQSDHSRVIA